MGNHTLKEHSEKITEEKCVNCFEANEKFKLNLDVKHPVWDKDCNSYKRKIKNVKSYLTSRARSSN